MVQDTPSVPSKLGNQDKFKSKHIELKSQGTKFNITISRKCKCRLEFYLLKEISWEYWVHMRSKQCQNSATQCALEEAVASCWRQVSTVRGSASGMLEEALRVHWRRRQLRVRGVSLSSEEISVVCWRRCRVSIGGGSGSLLEAAQTERWRRRWLCAGAVSRPLEQLEMLLMEEA